MLFVIICGLFCGMLSAPIQIIVNNNKTEHAMSILNTYGYMNNNNTNSDDLKNGIIAYQSFTGLPNTGILDKKTIEMMNMPRCGMPDIIKNQSLERKAWKKRVLNYKISGYPKHIPGLMVDQEIKKALQIWSKYIHMDFQPRKRNVDIEIMFAVGDHGDTRPFDGVGNVVAHAAPPYEGGAHFDDDENWSVDSNGTDLYQIAAHEFGHSLGLHHSANNHSLMTPVFHYRPNFTRELHEDDIEKIRSLYGRKLVNKSAHRMDVCKGFMEFDTIFRTLDYHTFLLVDETYIEFDESMVEIMHGDASDKWPGLPHNIDAAFQSRFGPVYFFKGEQYWGYKGNKLMPGSPKFIYQGFPGVLGQVRAVLPLNKSIFFFHGKYTYEHGSYTDYYRSIGRIPALIHWMMFTTQ